MTATAAMSPSPSTAPALTNGHLPVGPFRHADPTEIAYLDLEAGLRACAPWPHDGATAPAYRDAMVLVRLHGEPLGIVHLPRPLHTLGDGELAESIWERCADALVAHASRRGCMTAPAGPEHLAHLAEDCPTGHVAAAPRDVAIIVPTGGRGAQLGRMLASLVDSIPDLREVIVVDNRPGTGDTEEVVAAASARAPGIRYVAEPRPGSSVARNRGLAETAAEIVVFTDDDVVVDRDWLRWLLAPFHRREVGAVTGMVLPLRLDAPAQKHFEQYAGFSKGLERREYDLGAHGATDRLLYPYWGGVFGSGNSMAFRRASLVAAGGFDPALGAGSLALAGADIEAMSAAILRGERLVYEPRSLCWHEHRASDEALARQLFNYGVGFTAILTKALTSDRRFLTSLARSIPVAIALRRRRAGEAAPSLPSELAALQRKGMLRGPGLYLKSRRWAHRLGLAEVVRGR